MPPNRSRCAERKSSPICLRAGQVSAAHPSRKRDTKNGSSVWPTFTAAADCATSRCHLAMKGRAPNRRSGQGLTILQPDLPPADARKPTSSFPKQAIVVIHGMGEQVPMDTLRGFVRAVWETDSEITKNDLPNPAEVWSKPDLRTGSLELRRITTRQSIPSANFNDGVR